MALFSKDISSMKDLFLHELQDIFYAERQILKSMPDMISKADDAALKQGFQAHLKETEGHVKRLEQIFEKLGQNPKEVTCPTMDGLVEEASKISSDIDDKTVLDAALIGAAQAVEHYEIARYGTLCAWAMELNYQDCAKLLHETLEEEKATDVKLTELAKNRVNRQAHH